MKRWVRGSWVASLAVTACFAAYDWDAKINPVLHDRYSRDIREVQALDARLDGDLMQSRQALVAQYDDLVRTVTAIDAVQDRLDPVPTFVGRPAQADVGKLVASSRTTMAEKVRMVELFKSENAVLRNSVRFFPVAAKTLRDDLRARPDGAALAELVNDVLTNVLEFTEFPGSVDAWSRAVAAIDALSSADVPSWAFDDLEVVLRHANTVVDRGVRVDALTNEILAIETPDATAKLDTAYERAFQRAIRASERRRTILFALALGTVVLLAADMILRQREAAVHERRAKQRLAEVNEVLFREKEREKELRELKSRFVSMTSHEFRTPLAVILSSTELLEAYGERWTPAKKADHFTRIKNATSGMTELLDGVLVIGKAEMGKLDCNPAPLDIARWARHLVETFQPTLTGKHTLDAHIEGEFDDTKADEKLLNHIVTNLLSNAIKYSPNGGTVRFETRRVGTKAVFVVSDQGIGIPESEHPRLFESFHRCENVGHIQGTGLGLAVVKKAVDAHGGELSFESAVGRGTTFTVAIPLRPSRANGASSSSRSDV